MSATVADHLLERLAANGAHRVYGYPGDRSTRSWGRWTARAAGSTAPGRLSSCRSATRRWLPSRRARTRSSPARSAYASRTSGPGAIHLLNGLYDAKLDHQPVVAIVGQQIDIDARMIGIRYPMEANLVGDSAQTLQALLALLERKGDRAWRDTVEANVAAWWKVLEARAMNPGDPINPQRVFWELSPRLPDNCILSADSGSASNWYARDLKIRRGMKASLSGTPATMGPGVPYAIAAKFAFPDRVAIALVGDGAMQMNGNSELVTIVKYWERWSDPRLIVLVLNNRDLNQVTWEQRAMAGDRKFDAAQQLPDFPYAAYAELLGMRGIRVTSPEEVGRAWDAALAADRPVVIEAVTDPAVVERYAGVPWPGGTFRPRSG